MHLKFRYRGGRGGGGEEEERRREEFANMETEVSESWGESQRKFCTTHRGVWGDILWAVELILGLGM